MRTSLNMNCMAAGVIRQAQAVVFTISPWRKPVAPTRVWCLFEVVGEAALYSPLLHGGRSFCEVIAGAFLLCATFGVPLSAWP